MSTSPANRKLADYKVDAYFVWGNNPITFATPHNGTVDLGVGGGAGPSGITWQGPAVITLRRKFNSKTGRVELIKNGIFNRLGYLNLKGKTLTRRQAPRNYRYR